MRLIWIDPVKLPYRFSKSPPSMCSIQGAVALVGETDAGWLVDVASADEAVEFVHGTAPRAREAGRGELLVWRASLSGFARRPMGRCGPRRPERAYMDILKNATRSG